MRLLIPSTTALVEALVDVGQYPFLVGADRTGEAHKRLELGSARPGQSVLECRACSLELAILERIGEGVVEQPRTE